MLTYMLIQKLLGHSQIKTTKIYTNIIDDKMSKAVNGIPDLDLTILNSSYEKG